MQKLTESTNGISTPINPQKNTVQDEGLSAAFKEVIKAASDVGSLHFQTYLKSAITPEDGWKLGTKVLSLVAIPMFIALGAYGMLYQCLNILLVAKIPNWNLSEVYALSHAILLAVFLAILKGFSLRAVEKRPPSLAHE